LTSCIEYARSWTKNNHLHDEVRKIEPPFE
jgi:hypothetical protein